MLGTYYRNVLGSEINPTIYGENSSCGSVLRTSSDIISKLIVKVKNLQMLWPRLIEGIV